MSEQQPAHVAQEALEHLERGLGVSLSDGDLLRLAVTHRSFAFEAGGLPTNERLEFLGDAVLGLVVTDFIYRRFPDEPEGRLAKLRAAVVNSAALAQVARRLALGDVVLLGRGEVLSGGRDKDSILADTLEAVIGAVYLDRGITVAAEAVERLFAPLVEELASSHASLDYKTSLQEYTAAHLETLPVYDVTEEGPDHDKRFTAEVLIAGVARGTGHGRSKKEAEQAAAREAYTQLAHDGQAAVPGKAGPDAVPSQSG